MKKILVLMFLVITTIRCSSQNIEIEKDDVCLALNNVVGHEQFYKLFRLDVKNEVILLDSISFFDNCQPSLEGEVITVVNETSNSNYIIMTFEEISDWESRIVMFEPRTNKIFRAILDKKRTYKIKKVEAGVF